MSILLCFIFLRVLETSLAKQVNHEKTEILALGNHTVQHVDFAKHNVCEIIKILGVHFGYDLKQRDTLNYRQTLKDIKKSIDMWKWRGLSLLGRIQIIKTFGIPKLRADCTEHL